MAAQIHFRGNRAIPILMYHQLTSHPIPGFKKYCITPRMFSRQLSCLAGRGYTTIHLDTLLDYRDGKANLPDRPVIITFDDGFKDCFQCGFPILEQYGFTAVFFLVTGYMGKMSHWLIYEKGFELPIMDWKDARELIANGFQCGAHSMTHPHLDQLSAEMCRRELQNSKQIQEERLGCEVKHLAYPFGAYNEQVQRIASELGFRSACSVVNGLSTYDDHPLALHRISITGHDSLLNFIFKISTGLGFKDWIRSRVQKRSDRA